MMQQKLLQDLKAATCAAQNLTRPGLSFQAICKMISKENNEMLT